MARTKTTKPLMAEVAAAGRGLDLGGWMAEIETGDPLLRSLHDDLSAYRRLLSDAQVKACLDQRLDAVTAAEWDVEPGGTGAADKMAADFVREQLRGLSFDRLCRKMLMGRWYGFAVAECLWSADGGRIVLDAVKVRKPDRFRFAKDGSLRLRDAGSREGILLPERKFWIFAADGESDDDPHGLGLAHWCYWPVTLKRNGIKFWAIALEKFGMPTAKGTYPAGTPKEEIRRLLEALQAISTDAAVAIPQGMEAELIEATRRSGGDHEVFCAYLDGMIAKAILGQKATTEIGPWKGTADVQKDVQDTLVKSDADQLCETLNAGPVAWLTDWNFPGAAPPRVWRKTEPPEDLVQRVARDKTICDMGFRPTVGYVTETYGGEWESKGEAIPAAQVGTDAEGSGAFAEGSGTDAIDRAVEEALADWEPLMAPVIEPLLKAIRDMAAAGGSLEDLRDGLGDLLPLMDTGALSGALERLAVAAHLAGQAGAPIQEAEVPNGGD